MEYRYLVQHRKQSSISLPLLHDNYRMIFVFLQTYLRGCRKEKDEVEEKIKSSSVSGEMIKVSKSQEELKRREKKWYRNKFIRMCPSVDEMDDEKKTDNFIESQDKLEDFWNLNFVARMLWSSSFLFPLINPSLVRFLPTFQSSLVSFP